MSTATTPKMPTPPTLPPGVTKTCHIVKRPDFDGYGFNLHSEKVKPGQFIGKVDANSPAESAGLKEGDRILEVNGVSIGSETHKQVVARIKAIANEVRLLLIDVDGKAMDMVAPKEETAKKCTQASPPTTPVINGNGNGNDRSSSCSSNSPPSYEGTKQELPGASANISSISVVSTKRVSNASSIQSGSTMNASDMDVVDRATPMQPASVAPNVTNQNGSKSPVMPAMTMSTPPPPSATVANMNNNGSIYSSNINTNNNSTNNTSTNNTTTNITNTTTTTTTNNNNSSATNGNASVNGNGSATPPAVPATNQTTNRAGSLNLPLTVAEMRAKLASKKKYDPKNESVDLKQKFDIIQKL